MSELVEFLLARIDEEWTWTSQHAPPSREVGDLARACREQHARRSIVLRLEPFVDYDRDVPSTVPPYALEEAAIDVLCHMAGVYSDHPDWLVEWTV